MLELQVIHNPNGKVSWGTVTYTVRDFFYVIKIMKGNKNFFNNKKWGSDTRKETFVIQYQKEAEEFSLCAGAWVLRRRFKG